MESGDVNLISDHGKRLTRDTEFLHSFLRVDDESGSDSGEGANKGKSLKKKSSADVLLLRNTEADKKRERERPRSPGSPPPAGPTTFQQLSKEIKMKAKQAGTKQVRGRRVKVRRQEEVYTDKDRAAAVNMGSRDIKQSLKMKRRQDRSRALQIPEEAEPGTMLALGYHELRTGDVNIAINFVNKVKPIVVRYF